MMTMDISLLCDSITHPVNAWLEGWAIRRAADHNITLYRDKSRLPGGDLLFLISCSQIINKEVRARYQHTLVLHASDLPRDRGWSPHIWTLLNGSDHLTVTLLDAEDVVDSGAIWAQRVVPVPVDALYDEINELLFEAELELMDEGLVRIVRGETPTPQNADIKPTYHRKRTPADSEIDPHRSLAEQFNAIRVADPARYPAFFRLHGHIYLGTEEGGRKMTSIQIDGRNIGLDFAPYIIAELSANHNGDLRKALQLIDEAVKAGADAVKIQTYRPDTITLDSDLPDFQITGGLWQGRTLYELYEWAHTPWEWHEALFEHARKRGITIFSSPFDTTAVDLLEDLNAPAYKIASFEAIDLPLIEYVAATGKPMIISTGMADMEEIQEAIDAARGAGCKQLAVLHCVSGYPAPSEDYNLRTLADMRKRFGLVTGLSDHTIDNTTAIASMMLGASLIEKHFTLDRSGGGPDDSFSLEPEDMAALCRNSKTAWQSLGKVDYGRKSSEQGNALFRRSLYFVKALKKGERTTDDAIRSVRPGFGLTPKHLAEVLGKSVSRDIEANTPVSWEAVAR